MFESIFAPHPHILTDVVAPAEYKILNSMIFKFFLLLPAGTDMASFVLCLIDTLFFLFICMGWYTCHTVYVKVRE